MAYPKWFTFFIASVIFGIGINKAASAQAYQVKNNPANKTIELSNEKMSITLQYNRQATIGSMKINGEQVLDISVGIYSSIITSTANYNTLLLTTDPVVTVSGNKITLSNIVYGDKSCTIKETWKFTLSAGDIQFDMDRTLSKPILVEEIALPVFMFSNIHTWEGAYQGYGGLAWFYLFNKKLDTYGVHTNSSQFWNSKTGNGLSVVVKASGKQVAMKYSRTDADQLCYSIAMAPNDILPRFDSVTHRRRYIRDRVDVWAPFVLDAGNSSESITLSYFDFNEKYGRGNLVGINGNEVSAVLNTIARIGVIDKQHFGGNSWHTPYGPICLHEQYIAQMGLAINDKNYLNGYRQCLDFYRDHAIQPDGRVWPRWAYSNEDAMPGVFTGKGFYEAQWGYLLDANPDLVTNVAELYNQLGDKAWVKTHQLSCEKALDWLLKRDSNNNGLVEMMTDGINQKRGSDWIDIIWASYENAFVNAKLFHAMILWADIEEQLGNHKKAAYYSSAALQLKVSFNKPVTEGGFWDDDKKCYIHWRDKDGSIHGNNMVTPVNFMAIGYGICDDSARTITILDNIETQMQKEQLFFWPLCMYSYNPGEGNDWQFPFPNYENGDIFLSWGALGVKAYATYKPALALKYVKNVLAQYAKDGLAFQRYGRLKQDGLGDDILSGNSLSVVGLYQAIYGINPLYNRFYLNPHITPQLAGTKLRYNFRNQQLLIDLDMNKYAVSNDRFKIMDSKDFGFFSEGNELMYFNSNHANASILITTVQGSKLTLHIQSCCKDQISWIQSSPDKSGNKLVYRVNDLNPGSYYIIKANGKTLQRIQCNAAGCITFNYRTGNEAEKITLEKI